MHLLFLLTWIYFICVLKIVIYDLINYEIVYEVYLRKHEFYQILRNEAKDDFIRRDEYKK